MEYLILGNDLSHDFNKLVDEDALRLVACGNGAGCKNGTAASIEEK